VPSVIKNLAGGKSIAGLKAPRSRRGDSNQIVDYWFGGIAELGDFESIATTTVGAGGVAEIDFTSIPSTYKHLQVRALVRTNRASTRDSLYIYVNNDRTTTSYTTHNLNGDGASATSAGYGSGSGVGAQSGSLLGNSVASQTFSVFIMDILDYADTNKNTTIRMLGGWDSNGAGDVFLNTNAFLSTAAVDRIGFDPVNGTGLMEYSSFALYGIKG